MDASQPPASPPAAAPEPARENAIQFTLRAMGYLAEDKATARELQSFIDKVANSDLAESGRLREIVRGGGEKYQRLLLAMRCRLLSHVFGTFAAAADADGRGLYLELHGKIPKHVPGLTVPDNHFGKWILEEVMEWWAMTGLLAESERRVFSHKPEVIAPPPVDANAVAPRNGKQSKHVNGKSHNPPPDLFSPGGIVIDR